MPTVRWADLSSPEVGDRTGGNGHEVGLLPVGATEQHGPHLPTGTDTILATAIAEAVSARTDALVLPSIAIGCSYGHGTELPGTFSVTPESLADTVRQVVEWAAYSGLQRVILVNGHFGNQAALGIASDHIRFHRPDLRIGTVSWWAATKAVVAEVLKDGDDIHANRAETSMMLAVAPELVRMDLASGADDPDRTPGLVFRYTAPSLSTNGVTGSPSQATVELGEWLFKETADAMADMVEAGRREEPPLQSHKAQSHRAPTATGDERASSLSSGGNR
jgi:creatinine amidohydrolase